MKDNENVLVVCNPEDAKYIITSSENPFIKDALVITNVVPVGELTIISKEEFLKYLKEGLRDWNEIYNDFNINNKFILYDTFKSQLILYIYQLHIGCYMWCIFVVYL